MQAITYIGFPVPNGTLGLVNGCKLVNTTQQTAETLNGRGQGGPEFKRAVRDYVRAYVWRHGRPKTAEDLGVSRHTLWRFLERGHMGLAVPSAVLNSAGGSVRAIESARQQLIIDLMGLRPDPALRPLRESLEEALLLLCAAPLTTVDELSTVKFGGPGWT